MSKGVVITYVGEVTKISKGNSRLVLFPDLIGYRRVVLDGQEEDDSLGDFVKPSVLEAVLAYHAREGVLPRADYTGNGEESPKSIYRIEVALTLGDLNWG